MSPSAMRGHDSAGSVTLRNSEARGHAFAAKKWQDEHLQTTQRHEFGNCSRGVVAIMMRMQAMMECVLQAHAPEQARLGSAVGGWLTRSDCCEGMLWPSEPFQNASHTPKVGAGMEEEGLGQCSGGSLLQPPCCCPRRKEVVDVTSECAGSTVTGSGVTYCTPCTEKGLYSANKGPSKVFLTLL